MMMIYKKKESLFQYIIYTYPGIALFGKNEENSNMFFIYNV